MSSVEADVFVAVADRLEVASEGLARDYDRPPAVVGVERERFRVP